MRRSVRVKGGSKLTEQRGAWRIRASKRANRSRFRRRRRARTREQVGHATHALVLAKGLHALEVVDAGLDRPKCGTLVEPRHRLWDPAKQSACKRLVLINELLMDHVGLQHGRDLRGGNLALV